MNVNQEPESSLPSDRAFVIQFRARTKSEQGELKGRVEHLATGQMIHFQSQEELVFFFRKMLEAVPERIQDISDT